MNNSVKLLLLKIIKFNGDVTPLVQSGYEYTQIATLIQTEIDEDNAHYINGTLFLTEKGNTLISDLSKDRPGGSASWIEPEISSRTNKIDKDFIFLPNKKELSF